MDADRVATDACRSCRRPATIGCWIDSSPDDLPSTRETLRAVGRRLSGICSERDLTAIATRGSELLARLERSERAALGAGLSPVPGRSSRRGGRGGADRIRSRSGWRIAASGRPDCRWRIPTRAGSSTDGPSIAARSAWASTAWIARRPAHYVVFVRPLEDRDAGRRASGRSSRWTRATGTSWRTVVAGPGVSAAFDACKPFAALPDELVGAVMLQPSHAERHSTLLATGRVWKTHVVSRPRPDQVAISLRRRSGAGSWSGPGGRRRTSSSSAVRIVPARKRRCRASADDGPRRGGRLVLRRRPERAQRSGRPAPPGRRGRTRARPASIDTPSAMGRRRDGDPGRP